MKCRKKNNCHPPYFSQSCSLSFHEIQNMVLRWRRNTLSRWNNTFSLLNIFLDTSRSARTQTFIELTAKNKKIYFLFLHPAGSDIFLFQCIEACFTSFPSSRPRWWEPWCQPAGGKKKGANGRLSCGSVRLSRGSMGRASCGRDFLLDAGSTKFCRGILWAHIGIRLYRPSCVTDHPNKTGQAAWKDTINQLKFFHFLKIPQT